MANINELLARAAALRDETQLNSISPERAGGIMYDTLLAMNELWLQQGAALVISKIYASVAAMEADTAPVSDLTGLPLRPGQIVVIASSDSDNGSVYRYNGTSSPSWSLVGEIGNLEPVDSLDSDSTSLPLAAHQGKVLDGKISQLGQQMIYDVSAHNDGETFASLSTLLSDENLSTLIPIVVRSGGMSIRFVQTSDNKYVQFRCKTQTFSANPEDWAICDNGWYIDNPEFIKVLTDKDGKILIALEADGNVRFGAGVPKQIIEYVESNIGGSVEEIKAFLEDLGNTTLKDYLDNTYGEYIDNPEWVKVITDNSGGILAGIKADGSVDWAKGIPTPLKESLNDKVDKEIGKTLIAQDIANSIYYISNEEFVFAIIDAENRLLFGIRKDGTTFANDSVYSTPENIVNKGLINNYDNMLQLKALLDLPSGADVMIGFKDSSFQWVKTQNITDAWRNYTIDLHDGYVIIRDDSATIQVNASTICPGETKLAMAHLIPFDVDRLNTDKNMAIMVYCKNQNKLMRCNISTLSNALNAANWTECKLWEKRGTKRKIPTKELAEVDAFHRYDTTLDNLCYQYSSVNTTDSMIQFQGMRPMHSLMNNIARSKRMVVWGDYINTNSNEIGRPCIWVTTDGAENIVAVYDFCFDDSSLNYVFSIASEINTSAFADYSSGLRLYKVTRNIPSSENTDPWKYTNSEITEFTITKGTKTVVNKNAHGLVDGDIVRFAGTLTDNEWSQLQSNLGNEDARNFMGDNVYYVKKIDDNSFYLREFIGSYDNSLSARHIHSVNECKSGFVAYTGEEYPAGWGILLQYLQNAPIHPCDVMKKTFTFLRLNSSEDSVQRCCGFLMGGETDPICFAFSDTDNAQLGHMAIGNRVYNLPTISPNGIWKGHLSEIDTWNTWDCVCAVPETAIWTYRYGRVIVTYWQSNGWTISLDGGKNFSYYAQVPIVSTNFCGVHNNRIVINNGYELHPLDFAKVESEY